MAKNMLRELFGMKLLIAFMGASVVANGIESFINLDCGLPNGASYIDELGYNYTSDDQYVESGEIKNVTSEFSSSPTLFQTLRSFPSYQRNCYSLVPVTKGKRYLVRASFMYGNYDLQNLLPNFDIYLGVDKWYTVKLDNSSDILWTEIITTANDTSISVCLVRTAGGIPFISALELRPLDGKFLNGASWLVSYLRVNVGSTGPSRFKDDPYDRIWTSDYSGYGTPISTNTSFGSGHVFPVPSAVLQTADYSSSYINISWPINEGDWIYFVLHFSGLLQFNNNQNNNLTVNFGGWSSPFSSSIPYMQWVNVYTPVPSDRNQHSISIYATNGSSQPIISGFEVYKAYQPTNITSSIQDMDALTEIKQAYDLKKNWMGDPCLPQIYPWDGLTCKYDNVETPRIISLDLSSNALSGPTTHSIAKLTALQSLNLSGNSLTGQIPEDLASITTLTSLDLSNNSLSGSVPKALLDRAKDRSLVLRVEGNPLLCASDSCSKPLNVKLVVICTVVPIAVLLAVVLVVIIIKNKTRKRKTGMRPSEYPDNSEPRLAARKGPSAGQLEIVQEKHVFTLDEVCQITKDFSCVIGKGGSGIVYYGCLENGCNVAAKKLTKPHFQGEKEFVTEVKMLMNVHHKNLVSFVGYCIEANNMILIYEYMPNGNLKELLADKTGKSYVLNWEKRLQTSLSVATGLEYLHVGCRPPIIHRDIKSSNILLDEKWEAKIADFGLSKAIATDDASHVVTVVAGTRGYIEPEYYSTGKLTEKSDVYSFGVVLFELITGRPVFYTEGENQVYAVQWAKTLISRGHLANVVDPRLEGKYHAESMWKVVGLAMACTSGSAIMRPTMSEVVSELKGAKDLEASTCGTSSSPFETASAIPTSASYPSYVEPGDAPPPR